MKKFTTVILTAAMAMTVFLGCDRNQEEPEVTNPMNKRRILFITCEEARAKAEAEAWARRGLSAEQMHEREQGIIRILREAGYDVPTSGLSSLPSLEHALRVFVEHGYISRQKEPMIRRIEQIED